MKDFLKKLKSFYGFVASASVLIPGLTFFLNYSPPLIGGLSILASALSAAFVWMGYRSKASEKDIVVAIRFIIGGFILAIIYWLFLDLTSIKIDTTDQTIRYQVGFNLASWSLEDSARIKIEKNICPSDTKKNLLLCYTASQDNIYLIWKRWTVYFFGVFNVLLFTMASGLWSYGWGKLIKTDKLPISKPLSNRGHKKM